MVICETSEQARKLYEAFQNFSDGGFANTLDNGYAKPIQIKMDGQEWMVANAIPTLGYKKHPLKVGLILHDSDDKETRK